MVFLSIHTPIGVILMYSCVYRKNHHSNRLKVSIKGSVNGKFPQDDPQYLIEKKALMGLEENGSHAANEILSLIQSQNSGKGYMHAGLLGKKKCRPLMKRKSVREIILKNNKNFKLGGKNVSNGKRVSKGENNNSINKVKSMVTITPDSVTEEGSTQCTITMD